MEMENNFHLAWKLCSGEALATDDAEEMWLVTGAPAGRRIP